MKSKYSKELLAQLAAESRSINEVCKKLGAIRSGGSSHRWVRKKLQDYGIDTAHFLGQKWAKGLCRVELRRNSDDDIFCVKSRLTGTKLRKRYILINPVYRCDICLVDSWLGQSLKLHIDHINGICDDNRLENLRWICPNCHQQTETWGWTLLKSKNQRTGG